MRASDADRERTADILRDEAGEGRLEPEELEERLEAVYSARTVGDLDALTADLPPRHQRREPRVHHGWGPPAFSPLLLAAVIVLAIVVHPLIWLALIPLFWGKHARRPAWRL